MGDGTAGCGSDDGDDEFAYGHADGAPEEEGTAAEFVDCPEGYGGGGDVDYSPISIPPFSRK